MKVTKKDLLPPNIIIPENWDKTPIKFLDFLEKTHTGRQAELNSILRDEKLKLVFDN